VSGALLPTRDPYLYTLSFTAVDGVAPAALEEAAVAQVDRVLGNGVSDDEVRRARRQLRARLVFENDSITNVAHQLGYFETVAGEGYLQRLQEKIAAVTPDQVGKAARDYLSPRSRTVGWFHPSRKAA
jgi:zinc protease